MDKQVYRTSKRNCCVVGCSNTYVNSLGTSFYSFPGNKFPGRREQWLSAIRRNGPDGKPWQPTKYSRVCSQHFIGGIKSDHPNNPAYVPTIFPPCYKDATLITSTGTVQRFKRLSASCKSKKTRGHRKIYSPPETTNDVSGTDSSMVRPVSSHTSPKVLSRESWTESCLLLTNVSASSAADSTQSSQESTSTPTPVDFNDGWLQLEEMLSKFGQIIQDFQKQVNTVKLQSNEAREAAKRQVRLEMEQEMKEALNSSRIEAELNLTRAILEARAEKEIAVQLALQKAHMETKEQGACVIVKQERPTGKVCENCNREAFWECSGCQTVSYCSSFCEQRDWTRHKEACDKSITTVIGN